MVYKVDKTKASWTGNSDDIRNRFGEGSYLKELEEYV